MSRSLTNLGKDENPDEVTIDGINWTIHLPAVPAKGQNLNCQRAQIVV